MSPRNRFARTVAIICSLIGTIAVGAAVFAGSGGWPPAAAFAAAAMPAASTMLGVDAETVVQLGPEVSPDAKFAVSPLGASAQHKLLLAPVAKKAAKRAVKRVEHKVAKRVAKPRVRRSAKSTSKRATSTSGWKSARVSWYGPGFYGHGMAGGGKLTRTSMVVAHRSLPFGTRVEFSYRGRTVVAVVKDRGPYIASRTFDLGPGTAKSLHFSGVGTVRYRILR